eukprot:69945-Chlamydomonas_euryale.AAC.1
MKTTKLGRAPCPNDVPVQLWNGGGEAMAGLLARLYTAISRTGTTPPGFLDGIVTCLPSRGATLCSRQLTALSRSSTRNTDCWPRSWPHGWAQR